MERDCWIVVGRDHGYGPEIYGVYLSLEEAEEVASGRPAWVQESVIYFPEDNDKEYY